MKSQFQRFALMAGLFVALSVATTTGQKIDKANSNPPAVPPAKITQPLMHFTQGTITSIDASQLVVTKKVRGKAQQTTFKLNSQTQLAGHLASGTRVSVQYNEDKSQKIAVAVRELAAKTDAKSGKAALKPREKS